MRRKFAPGDTAYLVVSNCTVCKVTILNVFDGMYTVRFSDRHAGTRVKEHRLFPTEEAAKASIRIIPRPAPYLSRWLW